MPLLGSWFKNQKEFVWKIFDNLPFLCFVQIASGWIDSQNASI